MAIQRRLAGGLLGNSLPATMLEQSRHLRHDVRYFGERASSPDLPPAATTHGGLEVGRPDA